MSRALDRLFAPRSVAVVGASPKPGKAGNALVASLARFPGTVRPVHPTAQAVHDLPAFVSMRALPEPADLALLAVPAQAVPDAVSDCADAGVGGVVVHAGGFAELGEEGARLQERAAAAARRGGVRLLGPNTSGFLAPPLGLCASFVGSAADIPPGPLAIVAQSGGLNHALAFGAYGQGLGVRLAVGLGNGADVDFPDVLDHLGSDPEVGVIAIALEGVRDGRALVAAIERVVDRVPVVALKVGRTDVSAFAQSHTGAMTGDHAVTRAALRQAGVVVVDDTSALLDAARALAATRLRPSSRPGAGVVTGQAGPGLLLFDALAAGGVSVPELDQPTQQRLTDLLGSLTYQRNPVDTGRPGPALPEVLRAVSRAPGVDVLAVYLLDEPEAVDPVAALGDADTGAMVLGTAGPPAAVDRTAASLATRGIPVYPTPERTAAAVAALVADASAADRRSRGREPLAFTGADGALGGPWDEARAKDLLATMGIASPARRVCERPEDVPVAAAAVGYPVVLKALHPQLTHKTETGAVRVGLRDGKQLAAALEQIRSVLPAGGRFLVEAMAPAGPELLLGAVRDPAFGPIVVLGAGGVEAELIADVTMRLAPLSVAEAVTMLDDLTTAARFRGFRGAPPVDEAALGAAIASLGATLCARGDLAEIEVNPLRITARGMLALDGLVVPR